MGKRTREPSVTVKWSNGEHAIIEWNHREYFVRGYSELLGDIFSNPEYNCEVIHNKFHQAMLDITNIRTGESVHRQEINSAKYIRSEKWMPDDDDG